MDLKCAGGRLGDGFEYRKKIQWKLVFRFLNVRLDFLILRLRALVLYESRVLSLDFWGGQSVWFNKICGFACADI